MVRRLTAVHELDYGRQHVYGGKNQVYKFVIYLYLCRNSIVFLLNPVYLYIKLPPVTLFLKFSKFVT